MAGTFDATLKQLLDTCAPDWVAWLAPLVGLPASVGTESVDAELSTVQPAADKVFKLHPPAVGLLHIEVQSSWDGEFPGRLLVYNVLLDARYGGPVYTVALLLRREASAPGLTGTVLRSFANGREYLRFEYAVVRVWELPADQLLSGSLGASPLALITDDAAPRIAEVVNRFAERAANESPTTDDASLLLSCGYLLMGLRYDKAVAKSLFMGVQQMRESSTYQAILEEGEQRAAVRIRQQVLLELLQKRFGAVPPDVELKVRSVTDAARLNAALLQVLDVATPGELSL